MSQELGTLTVEHLRVACACPHQRFMFQNAFPDGFIPSRANFVKAARIGLDIGWAARHLIKDATTLGTIMWNANYGYERESNCVYSTNFRPWNHFVAISWWNHIQFQLRNTK